LTVVRPTVILGAATTNTADTLRALETVTVCGEVADVMLPEKPLNS
jgi:hypothetical protein